MHDSALSGITPTGSEAIETRGKVAAVSLQVTSWTHSSRRYEKLQSPRPVEGVELSRASAVTLEREDAITLRVTTGGAALPFNSIPKMRSGHATATRWKRSASMSPARRSRSVVLLAQVKLPTTTYGHVAYHFQRTGLGLAFKRSLVRPNGEETPLEVSLAIVVKRGKFAGELSVASQDYDVERLTGTLPIGLISRSQFKRLVDSLDESAKVYLDRQEVKLSKPRSTMRAIITREGAGLRVQLKDLGGKHEHFANGIVCTTDSSWHPITAPLPVNLRPFVATVARLMLMISPLL